MKRKSFWGILSLLLISLLFTACANDADNESVAVENEQEIPAEDVKEEKDVPADEKLVAAIEENMEALVTGDYEKYRDTVHKESPLYDLTGETIDQLSDYQLDMKLTDVFVDEKTEEEATVSFTQTTMKVEGPAFQNNETAGVHLLKPENGEWKIFHTEATEVIALDVDGNVMENVFPEEATIEGSYAAAITNLEVPFESDDWQLANYQEVEGEAIAESLPAGEDFSNFTEMVTIHYYLDGNERIGTENFISMMETNLSEMTTGNFIFETLEHSQEEGSFQFSLAGDEVQQDQEEVATVFIQDNDLFAVRYTALGRTIENKEEWHEKLDSIN
ncbi:hypothetical protein [Oceanobacillus damuensis]|uniref:hypothetical protein n=1 Tax=Oceanobacillus damuensis TaxID=937928 RepID=UPI0008366C1D|nr:hypothetical protein [Oceanobacillus damuensis]